MTKVLPPLKRDWKPGTTQLGLFIRFSDGATIEVTEHEAAEDTTRCATDLLRMMTRPTTP